MLHLADGRYVSCSDTVQIGDIDTTKYTDACKKAKELMNMLEAARQEFGNACKRSEEACDYFADKHECLPTGCECGAAVDSYCNKDAICEHKMYDQMRALQVVPLQTRYTDKLSDALYPAGTRFCTPYDWNDFSDDIVGYATYAGLGFVIATTGAAGTGMIATTGSAGFGYNLAGLAKVAQLSAGGILMAISAGTGLGTVFTFAPSAAGAVKGGGQVRL